MKNRIQISNSSRIHEFHSHSKSNDKIRKYCHKLIQIRPKYFSEYLISEKYILELLSNHEYEKLLQMSLKFIVKFLQNIESQKKQSQDNNSAGNMKNAEKINRMIRDIVSPIQTKIATQSQFYEQQLKNTHKACQTQPTLPDEKQKHFNIAIRQQSSILSSIQQESPKLNSPKFNDNMISAMDELSFERSSLKKDTAIKQFELRHDIRYNDQFSESQNKKTEFNMSVVTTPKQYDNYKQTLNTSSNSSFKETKRKMKNISLLEQKVLQQQEEKRFPKKEIPKTMLSVDFIHKRRKTPEKNRGFNIISNF